MKNVFVKGTKYTIKRSTRKDKKFMVDVKGKQVHFGAKGYRIDPLTKKADNYCTRSFGIKGKTDIMSPNFWSRLMWKCKGKKSK